MIRVKNGKLGVLGDTHGWTPGIDAPMDYFLDNEVDVIIQVGDFGLFPTHSSIKFFDKLSMALYDIGATMYAIRGNHDSNEWERLLASGVKDEDTGGSYLRSNIVLLPRTGYVNISGAEKTILAGYAGGAVSIDRHMRVPGESWWTEEELTYADIDKLNTPVEVLFTHDASNHTPWPFELVPDIRSMGHREKIDEVRRKTKPQLHFHGHMHVVLNWQDFHTNTYSIDCNGVPGAYGILDIDSMKFEYGGL